MNRCFTEKFKSKKHAWQCRVYEINLHARLVSYSFHKMGWPMINTFQRWRRHRTPDLWPGQQWRLRTPPQLRKTWKIFFGILLLFCLDKNNFLIFKFLWEAVSPSGNLNWTDLKMMQINFLVHEGRIASAAIHLFSSSRARSTSFATHLPYYRDQWISRQSTI